MMMAEYEQTRRTQLQHSEGYLPISQDTEGRQTDLSRVVVQLL